MARTLLKNAPPPEAFEKVADLDNLPVYLTLEEVAALYRLSPLTIRKQLALNTFRPLARKKYPYRWHRDDILNDVRARTPNLPTRRHGFAARKPDDDRDVGA